MPKPRKGETQKEYIPRAIRYFIREEHLPQKEAVGRAFGFWRYYRKKKNRRKNKRKRLLDHR